MANATGRMNSARRIGLGAVAALAVGAAVASAPPDTPGAAAGYDPGPDLTSVTASDLAERVYDFHALGSGRQTEDNPRGLNKALLRGGFAGFERAHLGAFFEAGGRRVFLHRPFGETGDDVMDFDALCDAVEDGHARPFADFGPWLERLARERPGVLVHGYLGSMREPDASGLAEAGEARAALVRLIAALGPMLDARNVEIGFDHASGYARGGWRIGFVRTVAALKREQGRDTYIETRPARLDTDRHDLGVVAVARTFRRATPVGEANPRLKTFAQRLDREGKPGTAPTQLLTGPIILLENRAKADEVPAAIARTLSLGPRYRVAAPVSAWLRAGEGRDFEDLARAVSAALAEAAAEGAGGGARD